MKDVGCNPCVNTGRDKMCTDNKCMQAITPSDVIKILDDALMKRPVTPVVELNKMS